MTFVLYIGFACIFAILAAKNSDKPFLGFILIFWVMAKSVVNSQYHLDIGIFTLSPNRVLFFSCLIYFILSIIRSQRNNEGLQGKKTLPPAFEILLYLFPIVILISFLANLTDFSFKTFIAVEMEFFVFVVVYTTAKRCMTSKLLDVFLFSMIFFSVLLSLLSIFQFGVNQDFLRVGDPKIAFGEIYRGFGLFEHDGELGFYQSLCLIILLVRYPINFKSISIFILINISIFLTFHRLGYLTASFSLGIYVLFYSDRLSKMAKILFVIQIPIAILTVVFMYQLIGGSLNFVEDRIKSDTVSGRLHQYFVTMDAMIKHPLGLAHYDNPKYYQLMKRYKMLQWFRDENNNPYTKALEVHNGYLSVGMLYGYPGMLLFLFLLVSLILYFEKNVRVSSRQFIIPLFGTIIWGVSNFTQRNDSFRFYYVLLMAIILGSFVSMCNNQKEISMNKKN